MIGILLLNIVSGRFVIDSFPLPDSLALKFYFLVPRFYPCNTCLDAQGNLWLTFRKHDTVYLYKHENFLHDTVLNFELVNFVVDTTHDIKVPGVGIYSTYNKFVWGVLRRKLFELDEQGQIIDTLTFPNSVIYDTCRFFVNFQVRDSSEAFFRVSIDTLRDDSLIGLELRYYYGYHQALEELGYGPDIRRNPFLPHLPKRLWDNTAGDDELLYFRYRINFDGYVNEWDTIKMGDLPYPWSPGRIVPTHFRIVAFDNGTLLFYKPYDTSYTAYPYSKWVIASSVDTFTLADIDSIAPILAYSNDTLSTAYFIGVKSTSVYDRAYILFAYRKYVGIEVLDTIYETSLIEHPHRTLFYSLNGKAYKVEDTLTFLLPGLCTVSSDSITYWLYRITYIPDDVNISEPRTTISKPKDNTPYDLSGRRNPKGLLIRGRKPKLVIGR